MAGREPVIDPSKLLPVQARTELARLAPRLAALLDQKMPDMMETFLEQVKYGLTATIKVKDGLRKNGQPRTVELPHWDVRKVCLQIMYGLVLQVFDRGGASQVRTTEMAGSMDINQNILERRLNEMSVEELEKEIQAAERAVNEMPPTPPPARRREPVLPPDEPQSV